MIKDLFLFVCAFAVVNSADWWEKSTLYQIFPRTFKDADNDGLGDLKGITSKLEYLKEIGLTAAWLSPIFKSPQIDAGYDVSDYMDIDPDYGTLEDLKELITKAKELEIKIILDFVPNHTSDKHEWFIKSVNGDQEYADFYIWREGKNNNTEPPSNWRSYYKGSAWKYNEKRGLWYYHLFTEGQPDLNFRNPKVIEALNNVMNYWLDFGIDGFVVDAVPYLLEEKNFTDEPRSYNPSMGPNDWDYLEHIYTKDLDETFDVIYQWREVIDKYNNKHGGDSRIMLTVANSTFNNTLRYYGSPDGKKLGAHFTFNFDFVGLNQDTTAVNIKSTIDQWLNNLPQQFTHNWVTGNHDNPRIATRLGKDNVDAINMLQAILPGIMVNYNGEEYGMENGPVTCKQGHDPQTNRNCSIYDSITRDFERTPMQWDNSLNAGFNEGAEPWLPVSPKYIENNIKDQSQPGVVSHLNIYKSLQEMRKKIPADAVIGTTVINNTVLGISRLVHNGYYLLLYNRLGAPTEVKINGESRVVVSSSNSDKIAGIVIPEKILLGINECIIVWQGIPA
ncbi:unnamed protein product [Brassicogethes aeneus]|uniref:alpha-glucosidase n=1 Tax=Brassicogethes aeneus TaxID=1431903 RepID=A0A9P0BJD3_BRAAE|nr:unnamed protein product [Brassicogethes aeneus]